jgi:hypothetical protein
MGRLARIAFHAGRSSANSTPFLLGKPYPRGGAWRCFSSTPPEHCEIVQGPSLLRTSTTRPSPSLLHIPGLRSLPFWTQYDKDQDFNRVAYQDPTVSEAVQYLEQHWETIRREYAEKAPKLASDYQTDTEHTLHKGTWDWHSYMLKGKVQPNFEKHFPRTATILQVFRDEGRLFEGTPFGYAFFSTLHAQSKIAAHSAPMNFRVRIHLPLIVPANMPSAAPVSEQDGRPSVGIRVGPVVRQWHPGKALVLDDAYNHEVWNHTHESRVLLLIDLWHPDITTQEKQDIIGLFNHAEEQGWLSGE